jgi:hypothetical protein
VIENGSLQVTTGTGSFIIASSDGRCSILNSGRLQCLSGTGQIYLESSVFTTASIYNWFFRTSIRSATPLKDGRGGCAAPVGSHGVVLLLISRAGIAGLERHGQGMFFNLTMGAGRGISLGRLCRGLPPRCGEHRDTEGPHRRD